MAGEGAEISGSGHTGLVKQQVLEEALSIYDDWYDMAEGPGEIEIAGVQVRYRREGLDAAEAETDLREYMRRRYDAMAAGGC